MLHEAARENFEKVLVKQFQTAEQGLMVQGRFVASFGFFVPCIVFGIQIFCGQFRSAEAPP